MDIIQEKDDEGHWVRNFIIGFLILSVFLVACFMYNFISTSEDNIFKV